MLAPSILKVAPERQANVQPDVRIAHEQAREPDRFFAQWRTGAALGDDLFELGRTLDGRAVTGIEFGAAGAPALAERPAVFLLGGLDGRSLSGAEAVLASTHQLLLEPDRLPSGVTFTLAAQAGCASSDATAAAAAQSIEFLPMRLPHISFL